VFARNDYMAIGAMHAVHTLGLSIPGDVAVAGFDNIPLAAFTAPPLTAVEQPIAQQGEETARFPLERIRGRSQDRAATMECRLIVRQSTDLRVALVTPIEWKRQMRAGRKREGDEAD
jgi:DNA-binding LacI/PurR family transcriptional regulator